MAVDNGKPKTCSAEGCERTRYSRGMCSLHYNRWRAANPDKLRERHESPRCRVDGCEDLKRSRGYCKKHYARFRAHGDPLKTAYDDIPKACSIDGCDGKRHAGGMCQRHYGAFVKWGDPHGKFTHMTVQDFLDKYTDKSGECWLWTGTKHNTGYGYFTLTVGGRRKVLAHRAAYEQVNGPIPEGKSIRHKCDTPACVNPDHLSLGSHRDNMNDMAVRGRAGQSKLTRDQVRYIRYSDASHTNLARAFGVTPQAIAAVRKRKSYKNVV